MPIIKILKNGVWTPVNSVTSLGTATPSTAGLMSASDKAKLDNNPVTLWENSNSAVDFNAQTITLNDDVSNYRFYYIEYKMHKEYTKYLSTGLIPINLGTTLVGSKNVLVSRDVGEPTGTSLAFADAISWEYRGGELQHNNTYIIPVRVRGIK